MKTCGRVVRHLGPWAETAPPATASSCAAVRTRTGGPGHPGYRRASRPAWPCLSAVCGCEQPGHQAVNLAAAQHNVP